MTEKNIPLLVDIYKEAKEEFKLLLPIRKYYKVLNTFNFLKGTLAYLSVQGEQLNKDYIQEEVRWLNHLGFVNEIL